MIYLNQYLQCQPIVQKDKCNVRITQRKTQSRIAKADGVTSETRRTGQPSGHLSKTTHDKIDNGTHEGVGNQNRTWASPRAVSS